MFRRRRKDREAAQAGEPVAGAPVDGAPAAEAPRAPDGPPAAGPRLAPDGLPTCAAPHTTLRFTPDGRVLVCCANVQYALGVVGQDRLRDIWDGVDRQRIADALDVLDYSLGCDECGAERAIGNRAGSIEAMWDHLWHDPPPPHTYPRRMEFAVSNTCNLQCVQCNGDRSSAIRSQREHRPPMVSRYDDAFFEELEEFLPHLEAASFAGGEPFLARETRRIFDLMIERGWRPAIDVVTNTSIFDERVEHYLRALEMDVTLSIDGVTKETFEAIRVGTDHAQSWANVDRFRDVVAEYGGQVSINFCLMPQNWHEFGDLLLWADSLDVRVDVIPVTFPTRFDILRLPVEELRSVVEALESQDDELRPRLGRNRSVWVSRVGLLRRQLDLVESGGMPVTIGPRPVAPEVLEAVKAELVAWSGQDLLVLTVDDGVIESVESPEWAEPLEPERWVGWANEVILSDLVDRLGRLRDFEIDDRDDGLQRMSYWFDLDGVKAPFRSVNVSGYLIGTTTVDLRRLLPVPGATPQPTA